MENKDSHLLKLQYNGYNERDARHFLGRSHNTRNYRYRWTCSNIDRKVLTLLITNSYELLECSLEDFFPNMDWVLFPRMPRLPHSSGVSVTSGSAALVLDLLRQPLRQLHLSYDVIRRYGLRYPKRLTTPKAWLMQLLIFIYLISI